MIQTAARLAQTEEYYFSKKLKEVNHLKEMGKPIINLGVGSPDIQPPADVIDAMIAATQDDKAHQYQPYAGIRELREGIQSFYATNYQVLLDVDKEILPLMGSKEGIMHISMAFVDPGDEVLVPNPGYPTYSAVTRLMQANVKSYDLKASNGWQPDLNQLADLVTPKTKLMWINYPHMPTGANADDEVIQSLIKFARDHNILLVNDNPYSLILSTKAFSLLRYYKPYDQLLELNSLSKLFNMAGWRIGMLCGNEKLIKNVVQVKSNMDSGMFYPIQKGAVKALSASSSWMSTLNQEYATRRKLIWQLCDQLGLNYDKHASGLFVWAEIPSAVNEEDLSDKLLHDYDMFVTPGSVFGGHGKGYMRFSLCAKPSDIQISIERTKAFNL
ncbi:MAG: aminotransferase class I/II-fold pyridoxal phosphate-dependent enzyme [Psychroflexus sp.]|jgi:aspartate/methionine/tyrosine aminotransferase|nr:aminotransferase class I/II-fold pyridoxal phosphate-dependent enzyme [Psychroflexus sp.]MDR9448448.1 aminotransferase class I/II-fold pyridoxal phosphate-dependent enzyme [Psychroflexus sp.]